MTEKYQGPPEYSPENLAIRESQARADNKLFTAIDVKIRLADKAVILKHGLTKLELLGIWRHLRTNELLQCTQNGDDATFKPIRRRGWVDQIREGDNFEFEGLPTKEDAKTNGN